jgi:hypothetical protein
VRAADLWIRTPAARDARVYLVPARDMSFIRPSEIAFPVVWVLFLKTCGVYESPIED